MNDERFQDEGEIGRGGMASVRRALDRRLMRRVAVKVCDSATDTQERRRFVEEAQVMAHSTIRTSSPCTTSSPAPATSRRAS